MFVRQVKRKCGVRGCKCTDSYAISRNREVGGTVIICKGCLGAALGAIDEIDPKTKSNIPAAVHTEAPSLFFNAAALGTAEAVFDEDAEQEQEQQQEQTNGEQGQGGEPEAANETEDETEGEPEAANETEDETEGENKVEAETEDETEGENKVEAETEDENESMIDAETAAESGDYHCPKCGRGFASERGLKAHMKHCTAPTEEA